MRWEPRESALAACETSRAGSQERRGYDRRRYIGREIGEREREKDRTEDAEGGWPPWGSTREIEAAACI